jgi:hypothetical protein
MRPSGWRRASALRLREEAVAPLSTSAAATIDPVCFRQTHPTGFFAQLTDCVLLSKACDEKGYEPYFFVNSPISGQPGLNKNILSYYFEQRNLTHAQQTQCYKAVISGQFVDINNRYDINMFARGAAGDEVANDIKSIDAGRMLFNRNLMLRGWVRALIKKFVAEKFKGKALGIHYRGKDKFINESDPISFRQVINYARDRMSSGRAGGFEMVYLATDDPDFYEACHSEFGHRLVSYSPATTHLNHFDDTSRNFRKNALALIDSLLLSECDLLVKTPSLLSAWSKVFNPDLEVVCVGRPHHGCYGAFNLDGHGYWPEKCLHPLNDET